MDNEKDKGGRPRKEIDWRMFDQLCAIHATLAEISAVLGVSVDTVERHVKEQFGIGFAELYQQKAANGKTSLRRAMWKKALEQQDNTMLIWLSKNHLGMTDKAEERIIQDRPSEVKIVWTTIENGKKPEEYMD